MNLSGPSQRPAVSTQGSTIVSPRRLPVNTRLFALACAIGHCASPVFSPFVTNGHALFGFLTHWLLVRVQDGPPETANCCSRLEGPQSLARQPQSGCLSRRVAARPAHTALAGAAAVSSASTVTAVAPGPACPVVENADIVVTDVSSRAIAVDVARAGSVGAAVTRANGFPAHARAVGATSVGRTVALDLTIARIVFRAIFDARALDATKARDVAGAVRFVDALGSDAAAAEATGVVRAEAAAIAV